VFIAFEGIEGAGKTTQARELYKKLRLQGFPCLLVHEPGDTPLGEKLRRLLKKQDMGPEAELFLFAAARAELVGRVILPALRQGQVVIADRFSPSTLAYQCYGRGLDPRQVEPVEFLATGGLRPDLVVLLDLPPEEGLGRKEGRSYDRFQSEALDFHRRVREGYLRLAEAEPERWLVLDARLPRREIKRTVWVKIAPRLTHARA